MAESLRRQMAAGHPVCAPLVLNPLMARLAAEAGFQALYLGGGAMGYQKVYLEANLAISEMCEAGLEVRAAVDLPLILDAAAGFGDPMHVRRTMTMCEAAGFAAIEIEDQWLPKRAHHHIGIEHLVEAELMVGKVEEAVAVRRDPDTLIVARTNATRQVSPDEALRRLEAYKRAGADVLLPMPRTPEEARFFGERLGGPMLHLLPLGGVAATGMTAQELHDCGFVILVDTQTPLIAAYDAMRAVYREMSTEFAITSRPAADFEALRDQLHETIDLEALLEVERRTVEK
jgi:methylisocitrate lyase